MKSIQQKHVTDHRATYCYKPQRAILIIALQKISRFVFNGIPSKRFSFIKLHFYYTMNMEFFKCLGQKSVTPEMNRKHNFKAKICFSLLFLFFSSSPKSNRKNIPSQRRCDSDLVSINFCIAAQSRCPLPRSRLPQSPRFLQLRPSLQIYQKNFQKNIDIRS